MATDADQRYLDAIADDCRRILGAGIELEGLERLDGSGGRVQLVVRYRLGATAAGSSVFGDTVIDAHARLREQLVVDRVRLGFRVSVDPDR